MEKLKAKRDGNKAAITRALVKLNSYPANNRDTYLNILKKREIIERLNSEILDETSTEDTEEEILQTDEYHLNLDEELSIYLKTILPKPQSSVELNPNVAEFNFIPSAQNINVPNTQSVHSSTSSNSQNHKLPKLSLPKFSGNILDWQTFWDSFETTVHLNNSLTEVQKFSYLQSLLEHDAENVIAGLTLTNGNYVRAVDLLKSRYGQPHKIINAYMK